MQNIKKHLSRIFYSMSMKIDWFPSWFWIYEPEKPALLKNK